MADVTPDPHGLVAVALDHESAFDDPSFPIVAQMGAARARAAVSRALLTESEFDVVVDHATLRDVARHASTAETQRTWLGDTDYTTTSPLDTAMPQARSSVALARAAGSAGVKFGIYVKPHPDAAVDFALAYLDEARRQRVEVVVEPYFENLGEADRLAFLRAVSPECRYFKCDVTDAGRWARVYGSAASGKWLARSDGMGFSEYVSAVAAAAQFGCCGAMVGRAAWLVPMRTEADPTAIARAINVRLHRLRLISLHTTKSRGGDQHLDTSLQPGTSPRRSTR